MFLAPVASKLDSISIVDNHGFVYAHQRVLGNLKDELRSLAFDSMIQIVLDQALGWFTSSLTFLLLHIESHKQCSLANTYSSNNAV